MPGPRLGKGVISAIDVSKGYGDRLLFENLNFSLPPGGIIGVIGANGAGKTTLFRLIIGEEKTDSGEIRIGQSVKYARAETDAHAIWQHPTQTAAIRLGGADIGIVSVVDLALRRRMDEHLGAWSIAFAELRLDQLARRKRRIDPLESIPEFPRVDLDFSILVAKTIAYAEVVDALTAFEHPLLRHISFESDFEGDAIGADRRSLTFRTVVGADDRTLVDGDTGAFRTAFEHYLTASGFEIRR